VIFLIVSNKNQESRRTYNFLNPRNTNSGNRELRCNRENEQKGRVGEGVEIQLHPWLWRWLWLTATPLRM